MKMTNYKINIATFLIITVLMGSGDIIAQTIGYENTTTKGFNTGIKPELSVSLGSSFSSFSYGGSLFSTSIIPKVSFPVSKRFSVETSIGYTSLFINSNNGAVFNNSPQSYGHVSVTGDYLMTEKISIRATAYGTFNLGHTLVNNEQNSSYYDFSSKGVILDAEYRVTDNFRINVGFEYREQNYPYYYPGMSPLHQGIGVNNPIFNPGFNPGFGRY